MPSGMVVFTTVEQGRPPFHQFGSGSLWAHSSGAARAALDLTGAAPPLVGHLEAHTQAPSQLSKPPLGSPSVAVVWKWQ